MFLQSSSRQAQLRALIAELAELEAVARFQQRWDEATELALARRQTQRALWIEQEFNLEPVSKLAYP